VSEPAAVPASAVETRRSGLVASALGNLADRYDQLDRVCALGLLMLLAGLCMWFSAGVALTVCGGLVLALGVLAAARGPKAADAVEAGG